MKTYKLKFVVDALKEWEKLDKTVREQFKKKLAERLENPRVPSAKLSGDLDDCYKIKLLALGYRLVYRVDDTVVTVTVIAVGKRERSAVYAAAVARLK
ncbi:type II toxin-antitoxin system RelE/ParE family toxin [Burkholderia contaminans]|uniref:type II toxin-antitoxin system RelE family toxin n=1 Tax=Burkholderia contaminans TaxID=488447 RepID=UPI00241781D7|nr:type II toxin-antitoxin system RelE/ParE family toxin [Burkholderia contaminans]WFN10536.1 type II toxin-antitoxin system RelE/ParE family toxin [Burkholderia contaminans]